MTDAQCWLDHEIGLLLSLSPEQFNLCQMGLNNIFFVDVYFNHLLSINYCIDGFHVVLKSIIMSVCEVGMYSV